MLYKAICLQRVILQKTILISIKWFFINYFIQLSKVIKLHVPKAVN